MMAMRRIDIEETQLDTTANALPKTSWDFFVKELQTKISSREFTSWFARCDGMIENNTLSIICPNKFLADNIQLNFSTQLTEVANSLNINWNLKIGTVKQKQTVTKVNENLIQPIIKQETISNDNAENIAQLTSVFNTDFSWDNFVQCNANNFAVAACRKVAMEAKSYPLLYLYGPEGSGKTHLLNAIAKTASQSRRVVMTSASSFLNDFCKACTDNSIFDLKHKLTNCDMLIIDSIQDLSSKPKASENLKDLIYSMMTNGKQVVISSLYCLSALTGFDRNFLSILSSGLSIDIVAPDSVVCENMLLKKKIPNDIAHYISQNIKLNGHIINGVITKLTAWTEFGGILDYDTVNNLLRDVLEEQTGPVDIIKSMCKDLGVSYSDVCSQSRLKKLVRVRYLIMAVMKEKTDLSLEAIGKLLGNRDHATVLYGINKFENDKMLDFSLVMDYENLIKNTKKLS